MPMIKLAAACGLALLSAGASARAQQVPPRLTPSIANAAELVFTPIPPCRAFLTSTALAANQARTFAMSGTSAEFTAQGGPSAGCGIPPSAAAVAISLTSFASTGTGHLRSAAFGDPISGTQVLSFRANQTETASVIANVKERKLTIKAYTAATKIAGDVTGYYAPQIWARIASDGTMSSGSARILSSSQGSSFGAYYVYIDRDISQCGAVVNTHDLATTAFAVVDRDRMGVSIYQFKENIYVDRSFNIFVNC